MAVVASPGSFYYAAGTAAGTVAVPADAQLTRIRVNGGAGGATVAIGGGDEITVPQDTVFDETIDGHAAGADVVIGGTITAYYVAWTA